MFNILKHFNKISVANVRKTLDCPKNYLDMLLCSYGVSCEITKNVNTNSIHTYFEASYIRQVGTKTTDL